MRFFTFLIFLTLIISCSNQEKSKKEAVETKNNGNIMLIGGGISKQQAELFLKFAGKDSIVVIPTAFSDKEINRDPEFKRLENRFRKLGINKIKVLHTRNRNEANNDEFCNAIKNTQGVFFMGGKTQQLVETYVNTKFHKELIKLLNRNGIIAGVSAGSGVQANFFDNNKNIIGGFQFLNNVIIMNHFFKKNKQFDYIKQIKSNRTYLAIGIDDNTAILCQKNRFEVIGSSYVAIYDGKNYSRNKDSIYKLPFDSDQFYVLQHGDRYDLTKREVVTNKRLKSIYLIADEYIGNYKSSTNNFNFNLSKNNNKLILKNSWGWTPYPIYPYKKDIFFAKNRTMWFVFFRDSLSNKVVGVQKKKSLLLNKTINTLLKTN